MAKRNTSGRSLAPSSRRYTPEFKRDAVALLRSSGRPMAVVARELGISDVTSSCMWASLMNSSERPAKNESLQ